MRRGMARDCLQPWQAVDNKHGGVEDGAGRYDAKQRGGRTHDKV
jgi:hypothetical protein